VIVCPACDLAQRPGDPPERGCTRCARCRIALQRPVSGRIETAIALAICALVLIWLSNAYPLVEMHVNGSTRQTTLVGAALALGGQGYRFLAILVFFTTVVAPFVQVAALLYLLMPLYRRRQAPGHAALFRLLAQVRSWSLVEVFMLGALAALVRLSAFAQVVPGVSLWSCALLMLSLSALTSATPSEQYWSWVVRCRA
jgi:paraquat-inducible protein A